MADNIKWTEAEVKYLLSLTSTYHYNLSEAFRIFKKDHPERTLASISSKYYYEMRPGNPKKHKIFMHIGGRSYSDHRKVIRDKGTLSHIKKKSIKPNIFEAIWLILTGK